MADLTSYPVRLRLSRAKGFSLQAHSLAINGLPAVNCTRPGPWGNPWSLDDAIEFAGITRDEAAVTVVRWYRDWLTSRNLHVNHNDMAGQVLAGRLPDLRGRNLACWCAVDAAWCHVDILLNLANGKDVLEIENGRSSNPKVNTICGLAAGLQMSAVALFREAMKEE